MTAADTACCVACHREDAWFRIVGEHGADMALTHGHCMAQHLRRNQYLYALEHAPTLAQLHQAHDRAVLAWTFHPTHVTSWYDRDAYEARVRHLTKITTAPDRDVEPAAYDMAEAGL